jgi:hypothetical protein
MLALPHVNHNLFPSSLTMAFIILSACMQKSLVNLLALLRAPISIFLYSPYKLIWCFFVKIAQVEIKFQFIFAISIHLRLGGRRCCAFYFVVEA